MSLHSRAMAPKKSTSHSDGTSLFKNVVSTDQDSLSSAGMPAAVALTQSFDCV